MYLDLDRIREAPVRQAPYPYFVVEQAMFADAAAKSAKAFPKIDRPGVVSPEEADFGEPFAALLDELQSERFREVIADKLEVELEGRATVVNLRGHTRWTDGNIHTDTPSKLVTVLLYFNPPGQVDQTGLRILNNSRDLDDFAEEVPPVLGNMIVFKVTPNCWHGHKPFEGERHSLQLNYLSGKTTIGKHQLAHRLWSRMKRKLSKGRAAA
jgi:hypothetical protein